VLTSLPESSPYHCGFRGAHIKVRNSACLPIDCSGEVFRDDKAGWASWLPDAGPLKSRAVCQISHVAAIWIHNK
jgi:hypothetical protein